MVHVGIRSSSLHDIFRPSLLATFFSSLFFSLAVITTRYFLLNPLMLLLFSVSFLELSSYFHTVPTMVTHLVGLLLF